MGELACAVARLEGWRRWVFAFVTGAVAAAALPPFNFVPVLILSFTALVWLIDGTYADEGPPSGRAKNIAAAAWTGWWFGFGFFLAGLYWVGFAFLVEADANAWMIPFVVVLFPAGLALYGAAAGALARLFWRRGPVRIAVMALSWVALEWLRGHTLTGFPWNLVGYAWSASLEMSQTSALVGIYGLSLLTVFIAAAPAALADGGVSSRKGRLGPPVTAAVLMLVMWGGGAWRLAANPAAFVEDVELRVVQPSIPQSEKWNPALRARNFERLLSLTTADGLDGITHIVWPESAVPYVLSREPARLDAVGRRVNSNVVLLTGAVRYETDRQTAKTNFYNSLHVIRLTAEDENTTAEIVGSYDKHHLVPFGEYMPFDALMSRIGLKQLTFGSSSGYAAGPGLRTLSVPGAPDAAPLICYEIIFPHDVTAPESKARWIVNLTNDAWFGDSSGPRQHLQQARMRAVETGMPVVRAANNGVSVIIGPSGRILQRLDLDEAGHFDSALPEALSPPVYARFGDMLLAPLALGLCIITLVAGRVR